MRSRCARFVFWGNIELHKKNRPFEISFHIYLSFLFVISLNIFIFAFEIHYSKYMTAVQLNTMNTELWQSIGAIADSEPLMRRLTRYAKKLVKEKEDPTLMTKEEFFAKLDRAEEQVQRGEYVSFDSVEELDRYIRGQQ